jgi:hypothetical protein
MRKNGKPWKENTPSANVRNETLRATQRLGRAIWKKWSGGNQNALFKLLGECVNACLFNSQVAELQIRVALINRFIHLGILTTVAIP